MIGRELAQWLLENAPERLVCVKAPDYASTIPIEATHIAIGNGQAYLPQDALVGRSDLVVIEARE